MKPSEFIEEWGMWKGLGRELDEKFISKTQHQKELKDLKGFYDSDKYIDNVIIKLREENQKLKKALVILEDKLLECAENNYNEGFIEGCKKLKEKGASK